MKKKQLVVLTGAGISAESGLKTFRDNEGLWESHRIDQVATPESFKRNPQLVLDFYNKRRVAAAGARPNTAHMTLKELESHFSVDIITQNVDNLHEQAKSSSVIHLHGELQKARSVVNENLVYNIGSQDIKLGDFAEDGHQLRPHIVWFGEPVPMMDKAIETCQAADLFLVVGTSLQVYPAAGLLNYLKPDTPIYLVDTHLPKNRLPRSVVFKQGRAAEILPMLKTELEALS